MLSRALFYVEKVASPLAAVGSALIQPDFPSGICLIMFLFESGRIFSHSGRCGWRIPTSCQQPFSDIVSNPTRWVTSDYFILKDHIRLSIACTWWTKGG